MVVVVLTVALIATVRPATLAYRFFASSPMVYIGLVSYSLYLWHWSVIVVGRWTLGIHGWSIPLLLLAMGLLTVSSYCFVEKPLRAVQWSTVRSRTIAYGVAGALAYVAVLGILDHPLRGRMFLGNYIDDGEPLKGGTWWRDAHGAYTEYCHVERAFSLEHLKKCLVPAQATDSPTVYLIGDSHARNYLDAIQNALPTREVLYLTMGHGCAFLPATMLTPRLDRWVGCGDYVRAVSRLLEKQLRAGDMIFVGQRLYEKPERQTSAYLEGVKALTEVAGKRSAKLVLLDATAPPPRHPKLCTKYPWNFVGESDDGCFRSEEETVAMYRSFDGLAGELAKRRPNFVYAPLRAGLCSDGVCGQRFPDGTRIYLDVGHITPEAAARLGPVLRELLNKS